VIQASSCFIQPLKQLPGEGAIAIDTNSILLQSTLATFPVQPSALPCAPTRVSTTRYQATLSESKHILMPGNAASAPDMAATTPPEALAGKHAVLWSNTHPERNW
jgi:hypothetical protein